MLSFLESLDCAIQTADGRDFLFSINGRNFSLKSGKSILIQCSNGIDITVWVYVYQRTLSISCYDSNNSNHDGDYRFEWECPGNSMKIRLVPKETNHHLQGWESDSFPDSARIINYGFNYDHTILRNSCNHWHNVYKY